MNIARKIFDLTEIMDFVLLGHRLRESPRFLLTVEIPEPIVTTSGQLLRHHGSITEWRLFDDENSAGESTREMLRKKDVLRPGTMSRRGRMETISR